MAECKGCNTLGPLHPVVYGGFCSLLCQKKDQLRVANNEILGLRETIVVLKDTIQTLQSQVKFNDTDRDNWDPGKDDDIVVG